MTLEMNQFSMRVIALVSGVLAGSVTGFAGELWGEHAAWAQAAPEQALTILADAQEANANTGVVVATGNVSISYPAESVTAQSQRATYYTQEQRIVLEGNVLITQQQNQLQAESVTYLIEEGTIQATPNSGQQVQSIYVFPQSSSETETPQVVQ